jgi:hypothetical protein
MHKIISMGFQTLQGFTKSQKSISKKKETGRGGGHEPGRPRSAACLGLARPNLYAAVRSRSDGACPFFFACCCLHAMALGRPRVWGICELTEGGCSDQQWLDQWWSGPGGGSQPRDVHAWEMVLARVSKTSRWAPVMADVVDELQHCLDQEKEGWDLGVEGKLVSQRKRVREWQGWPQPPPRPATIYSSKSSSLATFSSRLGGSESLQVRGSGEKANEMGEGFLEGVPESIYWNDELSLGGHHRRRLAGVGSV